MPWTVPFGERAGSGWRRGPRLAVSTNMAVKHAGSGGGRMAAGARRPGTRRKARQERPPAFAPGAGAKSPRIASTAHPRPRLRRLRHRRSPPQLTGLRLPGTPPRAPRAPRAHLPAAALRSARCGAGVERSGGLMASLFPCRAGSGRFGPVRAGLAAQVSPERPVPGGPIKLRHWIVPVVALQILVQVSGRDIGQLTDL